MKTQEMVQKESQSQRQKINQDSVSIDVQQLSMSTHAKHALLF